MTDPARWSTTADIVATVRRRWENGSLLRAYAGDEPFAPMDISLRGPSAADLGDHFDAARRWADALVRGSRDGRAYELVRSSIGGQHAGRTESPRRAVISTFDQAWTLLDAAAGAARYRALIAATSVPSVQSWALQHPLAALSIAGEWSSVIDAFRWLDAHRGSGLYMRQVNVPGVDTKFIERHRSTLAAMLGVPSSAVGFSRALGLARKPELVRARFGAATLGMPAGLSEGVFRRDELRTLRARVSTAWIIENEVTYLSVPVPPGGIVLWGKGYDVDEPASLTWLADTPVYYWGDLDTHGFAILARVRAWLPRTQSFLMDRETLLAHEERWGVEPRPTSAALARLSPDESALYNDLVADRYGPKVRLEQERIDWGWASDRLPV